MSRSIARLARYSAAAARPHDIKAPPRRSTAAGLRALSSLALVFLAVSAFRQAPAPQKLGELTVQRLNVTDANGTLRLVIAGKDRMHPGVMDGKTIDRPRPVAGMIFLNDEGDEVGGLTITGQERDGTRRAHALLAFDQLKQDQTIAIAYSEANGRRSTGLTSGIARDAPQRAHRQTQRGTEDDGSCGAR